MTSAPAYTQRCEHCGRGFGDEFRTRCPDCSGLVEISYDLSRARLRDQQDPFERFVDLLPIADPADVLRIHEGPTPCVAAPTLAGSMGLANIYLKLESANPSGTTKDRMAAVVLSRFRELGIDQFVTSSTGNSSNSLALGIEKHPGFLMHLFLGGAFASRFRYDHDGIELHVLEDADFSDAFAASRAFAHDRGLPFEAGFFNPLRREGLKTAYLEAVDQVPAGIDWYVQATSSAMGVYGTAKGAGELLALGHIDHVPRMVCVQQESCAPIVRGAERELPALPDEFVVHRPSGIVEAILRGDPRGCYPYVYGMLRSTDGTAVSVSEWEILAGRERLLELEGVACGLAAATTVAALKKLSERGVVDRDDVVLLNLTD
jgi:threonine synthase